LDNSNLIGVKVVSLEYVIYPIIIVFSITLAILAILAYKKNKNIKLLFLLSFFTIFLIKGIFLSINLFFEFYSIESAFALGGLMDAIALLLLYTATLKV
jgi:hypothetical protein